VTPLNRGFLLGLLFYAVFAAIAGAGGYARLFFHPAALLLLLSGTFGVATLRSDFRDLTRMPGELLYTMREPETPAQLAELMVTLAKKAWHRGIGELAHEAERSPHPLLRRGLALAAEGTEPALLRQVMEGWAEVEETRSEGAAALLEAAGRSAPAVGLISALIVAARGLGELQSPARVGELAGVGVHTVLYGLILGYMICLPLAARIRAGAARRRLVARICIEGLVALQSGNSPEELREKLGVYVA
jgi:chemotaxis protein MotA